VIPESRACPFCTLPQERVWLESEYGLAVFDAYPIAEGHTLVLPRKHVASFFDLAEHEQASLWKMVSLARAELKTKFAVHAFNIGINDGQSAGQTVAHAHIHVIPRRDGDVDDPRGGVRWVIPGKAKYWQ
jgi:diadenosine tetraphosphate (Ap4A) HIT family hydrolase